MAENVNLEMLNRLDLFFELFNNMTDLVFLTKVNSDKTFSYVLLNKPAKDLYGLTNESFGKQIEEVLPNNAYQIIKRKYDEAISKKKPIKYEDRVKAWNGVIYWESTITPVFDQEGECTHLLAIVRDLTEQRQQENEIKKIKERFELVWNSVADAMYIFDKNEQFVSINHAFEKLLGWTREEILKDKSISIIPKESKEELRNIIDKLKRGETVPTHEVKRKKKNGEEIYFLASYSPLYDELGNWDGGAVVYKDITDRKQYEDTLKQLALHDPLTGLPNRTSFSQCLKQAMEKTKQSKLPLAIFVLDIDHFKDINDTYGHDIGDEVLIEFTHRIKKVLRKNDVLARVGGDEFIILLPDLTEKVNVSDVADRIQQCLIGQWDMTNEKIKVTSSIGIAFYNKGMEEKTLFQKSLFQIISKLDCWSRMIFIFIEQNPLLGTKDYV